MDGECLPRQKKCFSLEAPYTRLEDLLASATCLGPQRNVDCNKIKASIRLQTQQSRSYFGYGRKRNAVVYGTVQRYDLACDERTLEVGIGRCFLEKYTVERVLCLATGDKLYVRAVNNEEK